MYIRGLQARTSGFYYEVVAWYHPFCSESKSIDPEDSDIPWVFIEMWGGLPGRDGDSRVIRRHSYPPGIISIYLGYDLVKLPSSERIVATHAFMRTVIDSMESYLIKKGDARRAGIFREMLERHLDASLDRPLPTEDESTARLIDFVILRDGLKKNADVED